MSCFGGLIEQSGYLTYAVKIEVQMGFCFIKGDVKACQDALGHLVITIKTVI